MTAHPGLAGSLVVLTAITLLSSAGAALAAVSCTYSDADRLVAVTAVDSFSRVVRDRDRIVVDDGDNPVTCVGGEPTVTDADRVQISHAGKRADILDLSGGPFAPGASLEPAGSAEIEIDYVAPTFLDIRGTVAADRFGFGAGGVNLNGDDDADVTGLFTTLVIEGRAGNDLISPQSGYTGAAASRVSLGGAGRDTLVATPDGGVLHGGNGRDRLIGGARIDNLTGGRGPDLIRAGKGRDLVRAIDGTRDRVSCGRGFDRAKVDGIDVVRGCERLIAVKRTDPVRAR